MASAYHGATCKFDSVINFISSSPPLHDGWLLDWRRADAAYGSMPARTRSAQSDSGRPLRHKSPDRRSDAWRSIFPRGAGGSFLAVAGRAYGPGSRAARTFQLG